MKRRLLASPQTDTARWAIPARVLDSKWGRRGGDSPCVSALIAAFRASGMPTPAEPQKDWRIEATENYSGKAYCV